MIPHDAVKQVLNLRLVIALSSTTWTVVQGAPQDPHVTLVRLRPNRVDVDVGSWSADAKRGFAGAMSSRPSCPRLSMFRVLPNSTGHRHRADELAVGPTSTAGRRGYSSVTDQRTAATPVSPPYKLWCRIAVSVPDQP